MNGKIKRIKYTDLFWLFFIGSILGFVVEGLWCVIDKGHWENHSATVWGPFCIVYGIGAVVIYLISLFLDGRKIGVQFLCYMLAGSAVEYATSLFQQVCFGTKSWDYSMHFLNLGGRVSLQMAIIWGLLGILFVRFIFPHVQSFFAHLNRNTNHVVCAFLTLFMVVNLTVTSLAILRWGERAKGVAPGSSIERILDERFDDRRMNETYSNMSFIDGRQ